MMASGAERVSVRVIFPGVRLHKEQCPQRCQPVAGTPAKSKHFITEIMLLTNCRSECNCKLCT